MLVWASLLHDPIRKNFWVLLLKPTLTGQLLLRNVRLTIELKSFLGKRYFSSDRLNRFLILLWKFVVCACFVAVSIVTSRVRFKVSATEAVQIDVNILIKQCVQPPVMSNIETCIAEKFQLHVTVIHPVSYRSCQVLELVGKYHSCLQSSRHLEVRVRRFGYQ